uniref:ataxin-7-like protein 1 n=1 Tax=Styela clava TaxID=7725 RepID=UPI00193A6157|nr:ataxin-7-like protein 1 [Styela clava]
MAAFEDRTGPELDQFVGNKWTDWLAAVQSSDQKPQPTVESTSKRDIEVARLSRPDMGLFGYRPGTDRFYLIVCEHCGQLVKPQSMNTHYERKHKNKVISKKSLSNRVKPMQGQSRYGIDKSNHRLISPPHNMSKQSNRSSTNQKNLLRHSSASDMLADISKLEALPEKVSTSSEKQKRSVEPANKNHRSESISSKSVTSQQSSKVRVATFHEKSSVTQLPRQHHVSGSVKAGNKIGGTIQLSELPEPQVVNKTGGPHHVSEGKHRHRRTSGSAKLSDNEIIYGGSVDRKRTEKSVSDSHSKSKRSYDVHPHHHHHHTNQNRQDNISDNVVLSPDSVRLKSPINEQKLPRVVLEKTSVPMLTGSVGSVRVGTSHKRTRPPSGNSESSSTSPPRAKVQALHTPVREKDSPTIQKITQGIAKPTTLPSKTKKKEKARILPLKAREYDPNVHCGVWVKEENSHCTRSLTCKVHPRSAKRAVTGRSKQFDELNQEHRREKQRSKEKTLLSSQPANVNPPMPISSTATVEFTIPSPNTKPIIVSSPSSTTSVTMTTPISQPAVSATSTSKTKTSISLFPKIYSPWHIYCWDNDEAIEEPSISTSSCSYLSQHPLPITMPCHPARRLGTCQVSYSRKLERQLESFSSNVQKFVGKTQKPPKPFSFTPIGGATSTVGNENFQPTNFLKPNFLTTSTTSLSNLHQTNSLFSQSSNQNNMTLLNPVELSGIQNLELFQTTPTPVQKPRTKINRKLSNLAPPSVDHSEANLRNNNKSEQTSNLIRRRMSSNSDSGRTVINAEVVSSSPHFVLSDHSNNSMPIESPNVMQMISNPSSVGTCNTVSISRNEKHNHNLSRPLKAKSKSAITKYGTVAQNHLEPLLAEHIDSSPVTVQLPNGINSIASNVLLKTGSHSVTLSGNIGALTVTGEDQNFTGNQISQHLKNMNSNNNFVMSNDASTLNITTAKSKHFAPSQQQQQHHEQSAGSLSNRLSSGQTENFILQNDDIFTLNQPNVENNLNTVSLDQFPIQNSFTAPANTEQLQQVTNDNETSAEILRLLCAPSDDIIQTKFDNHSLQLTNVSQIHPSILEQMFANQNATKHNRRSLDTTQGCSSSTSNNRTTNDLGQNFITQ